MPKNQQTEEVRILRFFESAPLEKAEMLFNIVKEKMRTRSPTYPASHGRIAKKKEQDEGDRAGSP